MKVIVAGMPKTGTKSMQAALKELGFNVYDIMENFVYLKDDWKEVFNKDASTDNFHRMFKNVDAVTDVPGCYFWDEIHKAFPEAKIILTMRNSEEEWWKSFKNQMDVMNKHHRLVSLMSLLSPTMREFMHFTSMMMRTVFGIAGPSFNIFKSPSTPGSMLMKMAYRRHNSHVLQTAPRDKLFIFNIKDGWEPLCRFLDVPVPDRPFPHKNVAGSAGEEMLSNDPVFVRCKRELLISTCCLSALFAFATYQLVTNFSSLSDSFNRMMSYWSW